MCVYPPKVFELKNNKFEKNKNNKTQSKLGSEVLGLSFLDCQMFTNGIIGLQSKNHGPLIVTPQQKTQINTIYGFKHKINLFINQIEDQVTCYAVLFYITHIRNSKKNKKTNKQKNNCEFP